MALALDDGLTGILLQGGGAAVVAGSLAAIFWCLYNQESTEPLNMHSTKGLSNQSFKEKKQKRRLAVVPPITGTDSHWVSAYDPAFKPGETRRGSLAGAPAPAVVAAETQAEAPVTTSAKKMTRDGFQTVTKRNRTKKETPPAPPTAEVSNDTYYMDLIFDNKPRGVGGGDRRRRSPNRASPGGRRGADLAGLSGAAPGDVPKAPPPVAVSEGAGASRGWAAMPRAEAIPLGSED